MTSPRRRASALGLAAIVALTLSACGADPNDAAGDATTETTAAEEAAATTTAAAAATTAAPTTTIPRSSSVSIDDLTFTPGRIAVAVGTRVTFTNNDDVDHQIVIDELNFTSPVLKKGDTAIVAFVKAGTYTYYDGIRNALSGTVQVG